MPVYAMRRHALIDKAKLQPVAPKNKNRSLIILGAASALLILWSFSESKNFSNSDSQWNGHTIEGTVPDACKGKSSPSARDISDASAAVNARYGNPRSGVESEIILAGDFSFSGLGVDDSGNCRAFFTVRGTYNGSSFADDVGVTLR